MPYADPAAANARAKLRYAANREKILKQAEARRRANGDMTRAEFAEARRRPKPDRTAYFRAYTQGVGRAGHIARAAARRARKLNQFVEHVDPATLWARDQGICHICQEPADPLDWHLEHKVPLSKGGEHSYRNTAVSHPACNLSKGARLPEMGTL